jgi:hypothetical protein
MSNFVEFEQSAPEAVEESHQQQQQPLAGDPKYAGAIPEFYGGQNEHSGGIYEKQEKTLLGIEARKAYILIAVALLLVIILAVAIAVPLSIKHHNNSKSISNSCPTETNHACVFQIPQQQQRPRPQHQP